jgi:hypothetical protein
MRTADFIDVVTDYAADHGLSFLEAEAEVLGMLEPTG